MKYGIPVLAALAVVFAAISVARLQPDETKAEPFVAPPSASFQNQVGAIGLVEASSENIAISLPVPGLVTRVNVKAGDRVGKGQRLFSLDDRDLRAELKLRESTLELANARLARLVSAPRPEEIPPAQARVEEAEAQLSDAKVQLEIIESVRDKRAIRGEDLERRKRAVDAAAARADEARAALDLIRAGAWSKDIDVAKAEVAQAQSQVERVRADLERLSVTAPINGTILRSNLRAGEYASAGPLAEPLMILGSVDRMHVRAEVDERDASRVLPGAQVVASVRGDTERRYKLQFIRFEPYVIPKRNLSGNSGERVDTRVLQVIYALEQNAPVRAGQQMDVLIEAN
jgi:multidrug resistance efflux pump